MHSHVQGFMIGVSNFVQIIVQWYWTLESDVFGHGTGIHMPQAGFHGSALTNLCFLLDDLRDHNWHKSWEKSDMNLAKVWTGWRCVVRTWIAFLS